MRTLIPPFSGNHVVAKLLQRKELAKKLRVGTRFVIVSLLLDMARSVRRRTSSHGSLLEVWLGGVSYVCTLDGGERIRFRYNDWPAIAEQFWDRIYTFFAPGRGSVIIDVGAHIGTYAVYASRLVGQEGLIICVEPERQNARYIVENVRLNKLRNVYLLLGALWDTNGIGRLYQAKEGSNLSFTLSVSGKNTGERVSLKTLDEVTYNLPRIDILKIDAEGSEMQIIRGGSRTLAKTDHLIVEVHRNLVNESEVLASIERFGFKIIRIERQETPYPIVYAQQTWTSPPPILTSSSRSN